MDKMKMHSMNKIDENVKKIAELFPECITETLVPNPNGGGYKLTKVVDIDAFRQLFSKIAVEGNQERYQFTWPDKRKAKALVNQEVTSTLRPCREESVNFDTTENLYIEGDNLEVLKLLQETYLGQIKMIYIDPPYNTGSDFIYNDNFSQAADNYLTNSGQYNEYGGQLVVNLESNGRFHTDWLNMLYPRLKLARDLLSQDGIIFISIDDTELFNLKKICDEIYGESNFIANLVWQSTAGSNTGTDIITVTENILVYTKSKGSFQFDGELVEDSSFTLSDEFESERGKYALDKMDRRRVAGHYTDALNYPITMPDGTLRYPGGGTQKSTEGWNYLWSKDKVKWGIENGFIIFKKTNTGWNVYNKRYAKVDNEGNPCERTTPFRNLITSNQFNTAQGTAELRNLFGFRPFDFPKPSEFIKKLLLTSVRRDKNAIIMDFFSGSATTAHAVMKLNAEDGGNRKFIMVQIPDVCNENSEAYLAGYKNICEIGKERIRKAGKQILEEMNTMNDGLFKDDISIDIGFRDLKLDSSNMNDIYYTPEAINKDMLDGFISNIKEDRTAEDLLFQVMLDLGVFLSAKISEETLFGKKLFNVNNNYLIACFDEDITEEVIEAIAKQHPDYFVMRDSSLASDSVSVNFDQIFERYSVDGNGNMKKTIRKIL